MVLRPFSSNSIFQLFQRGSILGLTFTPFDLPRECMTTRFFLGRYSISKEIPANR